MFGFAGIAEIAAAQMQQNAYQQYQQGLGQYGIGQHQAYSGYESLNSHAQTKTVEQPKEKEVATDNEILPDISLTRVFKWACVLIVAMALGKRVWEMFGPKIEANLHKALGATGLAKSE